MIAFLWNEAGAGQHPPGDRKWRLHATGSVWKIGEYGWEHLFYLRQTHALTDPADVIFRSATFFPLDRIVFMDFSRQDVLNG